MGCKGYVFLSVKDNTIVGNDVWIGYNTTFMPRVKIGDGAIIATNSTVTKDVDPYNIVGGSPAKLIRKRFDDRTIEKLLELRWWDMEIGKLNEHIKDKGLILKKVGWYKLKFLNYLFKLYDKNIL